MSRYVTLLTVMVLVLFPGGVARAAPLILLEDNFDDNSLDPAKWTTNLSIPQGGAQVNETGGQIQLVGRGHLNTVQQFDPLDAAVGGLRITGTWEFGADDFLQILTRSDGVPGGGWGETNNGIEMFAFTGSGQLSIRGMGGASVSGGGATNLPGGIPNNSTFNFVYTDDGTNLSATLTEVANPANTVTVNATSASNMPTDLIVFHNRESGRVAYLDNVVVGSLTLQANDATLTSWQTGFWDDPATWNYPTPPPAVPTAITEVIVHNADLVTVGQTTDVGGSLAIIDTGGVAIQPGKMLTMTWDVDVTSTRAVPLQIDGALNARSLTAAPGSLVSLGNGATLSLTGGGSIASLKTNGSATIDTGGPLSVSGATFDAQGATGTFTKAGAGTLSLENSSGSGVVGTGNTTFNIAAGTLKAIGAQPLGGTSPTVGVPAGIVLSGGTLSVQGAPTTVMNALNYGFYAGASEAQLAAIDDGVNGNGRNGGLFALSPSPQAAWPAAVQGKAFWTGEVWQGGDISDTYSQMWSGNVNVPVGLGGTYTIYVHGDDYEIFWLDVDRDGEFNAGRDDITRNMPPEGWDTPRTGTVDLVGGQTYQFAIGHSEGGGGDWVNVTVTPPAFSGIPAFRINPSDPAQAGLWSANGVGAIDMSGTPISVTADSGLHAVTEAPPAAFGPLTLNDGTTLTTTGVPMTFASVAVAGGDGRRGTLAVENLVTMSRYSDGSDVGPGTVTTLRKAGGGTLTVDNSGGGIYAAKTTFNVSGGVLAAAGANPLGGSTRLTLSGGTARFGDTAAPPPAIPAGALGAWTFNDGTAQDSSGNLYHGTKVGGSYSTDVPLGLGGQSLNLTGGDNYVRVDDGAGQTVFDLDTLSIAVWAKGWPTQGWSGYVSKDGEGEGYHLRRQGDSGNVIAWTLRGPGNDDWGAASTANDGQWHQLVATYGDGFRRIYQDGVLIGEEARSGGINDAPGRFLLFGARDDNGDQGWTSKIQLDDIYIYNRVLTAGEIAGMLPVLTPPDTSNIDVTVLGPSQSSRLEVNTRNPVTFHSATVMDGAALTTGGTVPGISFDQTILPGGTGTYKPEVPTTLTGTVGLTNPATPSRLVAAGQSDLILSRASTGNLTNLTFEGKSGRLMMDYAGGDPSGGAPIVLTGGALAVKGVVTDALVSGLSGSLFRNTPDNDTPMNLDGATYQPGTGRVFIGNKANTILTQAAAGGYNIVVTGSTQCDDNNDWGPFPTLDSDWEHFVTAYSGKFTPRSSGSYNFHWNNDDRGLMYIDVNNNGTFESGERVASYDWNANGNVNLNAGQAYNLIYMAQEFGGGRNVWWAMTEPGGGEAIVNPSDGRGTWQTVSRLIGSVDIQNTITVDNQQANALYASQFQGIGSDNEINFNGATYSAANPGTFRGNMGLLARTPSRTGVLTMPLSFQDNDAAGGFHQLFPGMGREDNFGTLFTGQFTPNEGGVWQFRTDTDDPASMYIDLDGNGVFDGPDEIRGVSGSGTFNTPALVAGTTYNIAIGHREGGGTERIRVAFSDPGADVFNNVFIDPGDPAQAGLWTVTPVSTLELITDMNANLRELVLKNGYLRITGGNLLTIEQASISPAASARVGLMTETPTILTDVLGFNGNGQTVAISKAGAADLILNKPGTGLDNATFSAQQGRLIGVHNGGNPFGGALLEVAGGEAVLASAGGDVLYDNAVHVRADGILTAGPGGGGGGGAVGPLTVTLGSGANGVSIDAGKTLTMRSTDAYSLNVAGTFHSGNLTITAGNVSLTGGGSVARMEVSGGTAASTGTGITERLKLGPMVATAGGGTSFGIKGNDLLNPSDTQRRTISLAGSQVTLTAGGTMPDGLLYHLDAGSIVGLSDGQPVAQWDDLSGNNRNFVQADGNMQPVYRTGVLGGQPAVRFDGSDDRLTLGTATGPRTVFLVNSPASGGGLRGIWGSDNPGDKGIRMWDDSTWVWPRPGQPGDGNDFTYVDGSTPGTMFINGVATNSFGSLNTPHILMAAQGAGHPGTYNVTQLGWYYGGRIYQGDIAEVVVFDRFLSSEELNNVGGYLASKYAIGSTYNGSISSRIDLPFTDIAVAAGSPSTLILPTDQAVVLGDLIVDMNGFMPGDMILGILSDAPALSFEDLMLQGAIAPGQYLLMEWTDGGSLNPADLFRGTVPSGIGFHLEPGQLWINTAKDIPEPATMAMLASAVAGLGAYWRKRRRTR